MNITLSQQKDIKAKLSTKHQIRQAGVPALMSVIALAFFELFNLIITSFALKSLLGPTPQIGISLSLVLAIAFCTIDIAGILNLTSKPTLSLRSKGYQWLSVAWIAGSILNLIITWWGLVTAIAVQQINAGLVVDANLLMHILPAFLAILLSLIRILIIGALVRVFSPNFTDTDNLYDDALESSPFLADSGDAFGNLDKGSLVPTHGFISHGTDNKSDEPRYRSTPPVHYKAW